MGLPLAIVFASMGKRVLIHDINTKALEMISRGIMPFLEQGAEALLREVLSQGCLSVSSDCSEVAGVPTLIVTLETPVDELLNPKMKEMIQAFDSFIPILSDDQLVILRSTVYPGTTAWLDRYLRLKGKYPKVAFCPERITQGHAIDELKGLPQIVSGTSQEAEDRAAEIFSQIAPEIIRLSPMEAELAKLFCNAYRYIQFAATNQFYIIANSAGLDYYRILDGTKQNYPRMRDLPRAGFAAGPCLLKDTMQLAAFYDHGFSLGHTAMLVNEGLPLYVVNQMSQKYDLLNLTVGLLGMAYKAESDDPRSSLSYKLKKTLLFRAKKVLTTDPLVQQDPELLPLEEVLVKSDLLILCIPHRAYQDLDTCGKPVIDIWNFLGKGALL